jgi:LacI family transcriptional regulator
MATINDIAKLANVNPGTVSRALTNKNYVHPETKKRILEVAKELDYQPNILARGLREKRTKTIAVLVPTIQTSVFSELITGVEQTARENDYMVIICNTENNPSLEIEYIDKLKNRFVDGFICSSSDPSGAYFAKLKKAKVPFVLAVRAADESNDAVLIDYFKAAYDATIHLIDKGCKEICLINGPIIHKPYNDRMLGFQKAMDDHGLIYNNESIFNTEHSSYENGYSSMKNIISTKNIDGVVASTDSLSIGIMRALKEEGVSVPNQVKLIDCTGTAISSMLETPLTVMEVSGQKMGRKAVERLLEILNKDESAKTPKVFTYEAEFIQREST